MNLILGQWGQSGLCIKSEIKIHTITRNFGIRVYIYDLYFITYDEQ